MNGNIRDQGLTTDIVTANSPSRLFYSSIVKVGQAKRHIPLQINEDLLLCSHYRITASDASKILKKI